MKDSTKKYSNGEVTIVWEPSRCIHSAICWRNKDSLREVFDPTKKPWIKVDGASTQRIVDQIKKCPSGALTYYMNAEGEQVKAMEVENVVEVMPNGPLMVYGNLNVKHKDGSETKKNKVTAFCRCGASGNKPYCDGSHRKIGFSDGV